MSNAPQENPKNESDTQHGKYLTFLLGNQLYGIEIKYVNYRHAKIEHSAGSA